MKISNELYSGVKVLQQNTIFAFWIPSNIVWYIKKNGFASLRIKRKYDDILKSKKIPF